jgi:hypothetical protein
MKKSTLLNIPRNTSINHSLTCEIAGTDANNDSRLLANSFYPPERHSDELFSCNLCHHSGLKLISRRDYGPVTMSLNVWVYRIGFSLRTKWLFKQTASYYGTCRSISGHRTLPWTGSVEFAFSQPVSCLVLPPSPVSVCRRGHLFRG